MSFEIDMTNVSDFCLSFMVDIGVSEWYSKEGKQGPNFLNENLKKQLPKSQIFHINSLILNLTKHRREILSKYDCYYNETDNSLTVILGKDFNYADFTREIMLNILEFTQKVGIEMIYFLVSKANKGYMRELQDLMIVGFEQEENNKTAKIQDDVYTILKMPISDEPDEIEDIMF